jgi:sulfur relay protein TusB/DsrH
MNTLHILNKASLEHPASRDCLRVLDKKDALLLIEDGVYLTQRYTIVHKSARVMALQHDLHQRGLSPLQNSIEIIDDAAFVEACTQYDRVVSWF